MVSINYNILLLEPKKVLIHEINFFVHSQYIKLVIVRWIQLFMPLNFSFNLLSFTTLNAFRLLSKYL